MMEAGFIDLGARSHSEHSSEGRNGFRVDSGGDGGGGDSPMAREERPVTQPQHARLTHDDAAARLKQLVGEMRALLEAHGLPGTSYLCATTACSRCCSVSQLCLVALHQRSKVLISLF